MMPPAAGSIGGGRAAVHQSGRAFHLFRIFTSGAGHLKLLCPLWLKMMLSDGQNTASEMLNCSFCNLRKWLKNGLVGHQLVFWCEKGPF